MGHRRVAREQRRTNSNRIDAALDAGKLRLDHQFGSRCERASTTTWRVQLVCLRLRPSQLAIPTVHPTRNFGTDSCSPANYDPVSLHLVAASYDKRLVNRARPRTHLHGVGHGASCTRTWRISTSAENKPTLLSGRRSSIMAARRAGRSLLPPVRDQPRGRGAHIHGHLPDSAAQGRGGFWQAPHQRAHSPASTTP